MQVEAEIGVKSDQGGMTPFGRIVRQMRKAPGDSVRLKVVQRSRCSRDSAALVVNTNEILQMGRNIQIVFLTLVTTCIVSTSESVPVGVVFHEETLTRKGVRGDTIVLEKPVTRLTELAPSAVL